MSEITISQLQGILAGAANLIDTEVAAAVKATALKVEETQKATIPVKTGRTRDSIKATGPDGGALGAKTVEAVIGPRKPWAHTGRWIETGTVKMGPRVYVANSYEPHRAAHEAGIARAGVAALKGLT